MVQVNEARLINSLSHDDMHTLMSIEQAHNRRLSRVGRGGTTTDTVIGGVAGAGIGATVGLALAALALPGAEGIMAGMTPIVMGLGVGGVGTLLGSYIDLHAVANLWRR